MQGGSAPAEGNRNAPAAQRCPGHPEGGPECVGVLLSPGAVRLQHSACIEHITDCGPKFDLNLMNRHELAFMVAIRRRGGRDGTGRGYSKGRQTQFATTGLQELTPCSRCTRSQ